MPSAPTVNWKKRILLPIWIVRIILTLFIIASYAWAVQLLREVDEYYYDGTEINWAGIAVYLAILSSIALMDFAQVLLFMLDRLQPLLFLILNAVQTAFWVANIIIQAIYIGKYGNRATGIGLVIFMFILYLSLLVYAVVGFRKSRKQSKFGKYMAADNTHEHDNNFLLSQGTSVSSNVNTAYDPSTQYGNYNNQYSIPLPPQKPRGTESYA